MYLEGNPSVAARSPLWPRPAPRSWKKTLGGTLEAVSIRTAILAIQRTEVLHAQLDLYISTSSFVAHTSIERPLECCDNFETVCMKSDLLVGPHLTSESVVVPSTATT